MIRAAKPFSNFPAKVLYPQLPAAWHKITSHNEKHPPAQWLPFFSFSQGWVLLSSKPSQFLHWDLIGASWCFSIWQHLADAHALHDPRDALSRGAYGAAVCSPSRCEYQLQDRQEPEIVCRTGETQVWLCDCACNWYIIYFTYYAKWYWSWIWVNLRGDLPNSCHISASWGCWFATNGYSCALKMVMTCNVWWIFGLQETIWIGFFHNTSRQISHKKVPPELGCCESTSAILSVAVHNFYTHRKKTYDISRWHAFRMSKVSPHSEAAWWKLNTQFLTFKGGKKSGLEKRQF